MTNQYSADLFIKKSPTEVADNALKILSDAPKMDFIDRHVLKQRFQYIPFYLISLNEIETKPLCELYPVDTFRGGAVFKGFDASVSRSYGGFIAKYEKYAVHMHMTCHFLFVLNDTNVESLFSCNANDTENHFGKVLFDTSFIRDLLADLLLGYESNGWRLCYNDNQSCDHRRLSPRIHSGLFYVSALIPIAVAVFLTMTGHPDIRTAVIVNNYIFSVSAVGLFTISLSDAINDRFICKIVSGLASGSGIILVALVLSSFHEWYPPHHS